jgi:uncharacterized protein (TIGR02001 family)
LLTLAALAPAAKASAGVQATVAVASDDRFRGRSVSQGRPTASLDISYDAQNGGYLGLEAAVVAAAHEGVRLLRVQEYAGYAVRLPAGPSLDAGVSHTDYTDYYSGDGSAAYTELYAGVVTRRFATHLYYSPDYFGRHDATLYGEVDTALRPAPGWRLSAHAGLLSLLSGARYAEVKPTQYDWRLGLAKSLRRFEIELSWSGAGPNPDYYGGEPRARSGAVVALKCAF